MTSAQWAQEAPFTVHMIWTQTNVQIMSLKAETSNQYIFMKSNDGDFEVTTERQDSSCLQGGHRLAE